MAYTAPFIDATGMHIPTYAEIRDDLIEQMKQIFGQDIYISEDTQDYQQISIMAKKIYDTNALALMVYNNRTPNTAVGIGLDNLCSLVGITRNPARYSTIQLTLTGVNGTVISNGQASDGTNIWNLPTTVTIPESGTITVEATCEVPGRVIAPANTITIIETPVYGWISVTNNYANTDSAVGTDLESDAALRGRFSISTMSPSTTVFEGMVAAVEDLEGVTRVKAYENDTNVTSSEGFPPHSVTFVVEGGDNVDIATEIYYKKTPGCYTNGTTLVPLVSLGGITTNIRFYRPTSKRIYAKVNITPLADYTETYEDKIKEALSKYVNELQIADSVYRNVLLSVVISQMNSIANPSYAVTNLTLSTDGSSFTTNDITLLFNEVASLSVEDITVVV